MINTVLFDLDGTLLPHDLSVFAKTYFQLLSKRLIKEGFGREDLGQILVSSLNAVKNSDGTKLNCEVFWQSMAEKFGSDIRVLENKLEDFYTNEFCELKKVCSYNPLVPKLIKRLKDEGYRLILATNPVFPPIASEIRASWGGVDVRDFELLTHYGNFHTSKPSVEYYKELIKTADIDVNTALMVGNDARDDGAAREAGIDVFLITDTPVIREDIPITSFKNGSFADLEKYIFEN